MARNNTAIGGGVAVLTERDGRPLGETRNRIDLISAQDYYVGSRYVRDLRTSMWYCSNHGNWEDRDE